MIVTAIHKNTTAEWIFEMFNPCGQSNIPCSCNGNGSGNKQKEQLLPQIFW